MKTLRRFFAPLLLLGFACPAHAFLVNYEFEGLVTGSNVSWANAGDKMSGVLSFDPATATPASLDHAPGVFDFTHNNLLLSVNVGPYAFVCQNTTGAGAYFTSDSFSMQEMIFQNQDWARMDMGATGSGLFGDSPRESLEGGQWNAVTGGNPWAIETFNEGYGNSVSGRFTLFRYVDAVPTPEPPAAASLAAAVALLAWTALRRSRRSAVAVRR